MDDVFDGVLKSGCDRRESGDETADNDKKNVDGLFARGLSHPRELKVEGKCPGADESKWTSKSPG